MVKEGLEPQKPAICLRPDPLTWIGQMAKQIKTLAAKPDKLRWVPGTLMMETENQPVQPTRSRPLEIQAGVEFL